MVRRKSTKLKRRRLSDEELMFIALAKVSIEYGVSLFKKTSPVAKNENQCAYDYFEF